jgi:hypothetical protein
MTKAKSQKINLPKLHAKFHKTSKMWWKLGQKNLTDIHPKGRAKFDGTSKIWQKLGQT